MTIYDELRKLAIQNGVDVSDTHNIKDILRKWSAKYEGNTNGAAIADAIKNVTEAQKASVDDISVQSIGDLQGLRPSSGVVDEWLGGKK